MPFTVYIDDSGTSPANTVAIAAALVIPARRIVAMDREWAKLARKEHFADFHASECVARNQKSEYALWDDDKVFNVLGRVREMAKKYGVVAFSTSVNKEDYDEVVPEILRKYAGRYHYTWALRHLLRFVDRWGQESGDNTPFEYIYDCMAKGEAKKEVVTVMEQAERGAQEQGLAGRYVNYSFRMRKEIPALQCADTVAWTCFQQSLFVLKNIPLSKFGKECWNHLYDKKEEWLRAYTIRRDALARWVNKELEDGWSIKRFQMWGEEKKREKEARMRKIRGGNSARYQRLSSRSKSEKAEDSEKA